MTSNAIQDQREREQALNPSESFIVQAPAGSGKTELIIQRFLTLLAYVKNPEEILAITFTKKSAHEMRTRVLKALDHALYHPEPEPDHEKKTWRLATAVLKRDRELKWDLINNPNQLHIKTIDSFCTYLNSQLPLLSHFGAQPDINTHSNSLYREAVLEVLSHIEEQHDWSPAVAKLLIHMDNDLDKLSRLLIKLLEKRDQWQRYLNLDLSDAEIRRLLTSQIDSVINLKLESAAELCPGEYMDELLLLLRFAAVHLVQSDSESPITYFRDCELPPDATSKNIRKWQGIADFLLNNDGDWRQKTIKTIGFPAFNSMPKSEEPMHRAMQTRYKTLVNHLSIHDDFRESLVSIRLLPYPEYTDAQWETLKALLEVLKITLAQLRVTFQLHGQIDFIENAAGAALALGDEQNPTDLALALDYQIKHIMVDEFQDTSFTQYRLLEMLTHGWQPHDGRTLFVVGDPMQSIYRFRQAEVGIFIRMQEQGIGQLRLNKLALTVNFRSAKSIVEWNNQQFSSIFPKADNISTGAVKFNPSVANQSSQAVHHADVSMQGFISSSNAAQAKVVIDYIKASLERHPNEKIAILVRSRPHLASIIPGLKAAKIRYNAVDIDPLASRQCIQDLLALTRALIHPADRIAWLAVLRAPWCGLTLADLLLLCGQERKELIVERLHNTVVLEKLSHDGQRRIQTILPILDAAINHRERLPFRQWVEQTWMRLGGPATLEDYAEILDIDEFFNLLAELANHSQSVNLEMLSERIKHLRASSHHDDAPVQIMTVHSAKGLEFDTVILPHLEKTNSSDDKSLLLWMEYPLERRGQKALLLAPLHAVENKSDALYDYIEQTQRTKLLYEVDRLFYVAATRAKKRLHLVFNLKESDKAPAGSFLEKLWPQIKNNVTLIEPENTRDEAKAIIPSHAIMRFDTNWQNPVTYTDMPEQASRQNKNGFHLVDQRARLIGTVTHTLFQQISLHGMEWWRQIPIHDQINYIIRELASTGFSAHHINEGAKLIHAMLKRALNDEACRWILSPHTNAKSEYQLTLVTSEGCENIIIDRTFIDKDGNRWIIDYKTAENQDDDLQSFIKKQKDKYSLQLAKYRQALQVFDARPVKSGLYFPALAVWCECS